jgi:FkbH-like protein
LFDDSPFEREEVRRALPAVTVIEVPADPLRYIETIEESAAFDQLTITAEDRHRADSYRQQLSRAEASRAATSPEEFLAGLDMVATIGQVTSDTLPRVAQLLAKTNQFNLTTRRHSAAQIADLIAGGAMALWLRLADRFGDHGLVGVALAAPSGSQWVIDTFLLSCRVIGRGVESILLSQVATSVRSRSGRELVGEYLPTGKNALVADFYPRHDFSPVGENRWIKNLSEAIPAPGYIRIEFHE